MATIYREAKVQREDYISVWQEAVEKEMSILEISMKGLEELVQEFRLEVRGIRKLNNFVDK